LAFAGGIKNMILTKPRSFFALPKFHPMKRLFALLLLTLAIDSGAQEFQTRFESSGGRQSAPYEEVISFYRSLDREFPTIDIQEAGPTDTRFPLHVVYYSKDGIFDIADWRKKGKLIIIINNGIHPGEPDGIDASMMLLRDAAMGKLDMPNNIVLAVIPVFNIGGALNRGSHSRANQNGPEEYGFRGNAQNLDLNRDFIKLDARETQTLIRLFHKLDPEVFIDNHVSNGADYQHVMTLLTPNADKLGGELGAYLEDELEPALYKGMKGKGYALVPYVNHWNDNPVEHGWMQFNDPPRFASGFASLFQTLSFVPETHMLKPFKQRVEATYALMETMIAECSKRAVAIRHACGSDLFSSMEQTAFVLDWKADTTQSTTIEFMGYQAGKKPSEVSGQPRLYYDRSKPFTRSIPYFNHFKAGATATAPQYYIIQQGWHRVIDRLKMNGVQMRQLMDDSIISVTVYRISNYETGKRPYEGHYLHTGVQYTKKQETIKLLKGDYLIPTMQRSKRYLVETLEPNAPDAFLAWEFFDAVLQQKEGHSDYVFEDVAAEMLRNDPALKAALEEAKKKDPALAKDGEAQLDFIYKRSPYFEPVNMRYPVFRID
jgi:hypothetical protein